jgi:hypothetical protein
MLERFLEVDPNNKVTGAYRVFEESLYNEAIGEYEQIIEELENKMKGIDRLTDPEGFEAARKN